MKKLRIINACLICLIGGELYAQFQFTGKPRYEVVTKRNGTLLGVLNIELFPNIAPYHVKNFDSLVAQKFYDTTAFHRVVPGFVIQGGDPNSRNGPVNTWGFGQPWQPTVKAEFSAAKHLRGILSAARKGNDIHSATSQFFICVAQASNLDGSYSVYGRVTTGMTVVDTIVLQPVVPNTQRPVQKIEMFITYIGSNDSVPLPPVLNFPTNGTLDVDTVLYANLKWNAVHDGIIYQAQVARDSTFTVTDTIMNTAGTSSFLKNVKGYSTYYWRVRTNNGGHYSEWTQPWRFSTKPAPVDETGISETLSGLKISVYPNPGKDNFTFRNTFSGDQVEVFDCRNKLLRILTANDKSVSVNLTDHPPGIYFYRIIRPGETTQTGKLILK